MIYYGEMIYYGGMIYYGEMIIIRSEECGIFLEDKMLCGLIGESGRAATGKKGWGGSVYIPHTLAPKTASEPWVRVCGKLM